MTTSCSSGFSPTEVLLGVTTCVAAGVRDPNTSSVSSSSPTTSSSSTELSITSASNNSTTSASVPSSLTSSLTNFPTVVTTILPDGVPNGTYYCEGDSVSAIYCSDISSEAVPVYTVTYSTTSRSKTVFQTIFESRPLLSSTSSTVTTTSSSSSSSTSTTSSLQSTTSPTSASTAGQTAETVKSNASKSSNGNTGAVAGAAVGCFLAGLAIAGLIAFFILRKRKNQRYARPANYAPAPAHVYGGEKGTPLVAVSPASPDFLPQQADDGEIRRRISTVIDQIDQHVENFYINHAIQLTPQMESELSRFETSQLPQPLAMCFAMSSQPTVLIKHCLAFHMFNLTMAPGEGTMPILPPEIANMVSATYSKSVAPQVSKEFIQAFSSWKRLTAYLRPDLLRDPRTLNKSAEASARIASHFTAVFAPWRNDVYSDEQRSGHLSELLDHAVFTALWLFGQPDNFRFDWVVLTPDMNRTASMHGGGVRGGSDKIIVAPGVSKVTYAGARLPGLGQQILAPVLRRV